MKLMDFQKTLICKYYDDLISKYPSVAMILHGKLNPEFIKFGDYDTGAKAIHARNIFVNSEAIIKKYPVLEKNSVVQFISSPDFKVFTDVPYDSLNKYGNCLEDAILYRYLYEQVIVEPLQKRPCNEFKRGEKVIPLTKISKLLLSTDLVYVKEDILFIHEDIYNSLLNYYLKRMALKYGIGTDKVAATQDILLDLWNQLASMKFEVFRCIKPAVYTDIKEFHDKFTNYHTKDFNDKDFVFRDKMALDNRAHAVRKEDQEYGDVCSLTFQRIGLNK